VVPLDGPLAGLLCRMSGGFLDPVVMLEPIDGGPGCQYGYEVKVWRVA
jgi:hypothetical protein